MEFRQYNQLDVDDDRVIDASLIYKYAQSNKPEQDRMLAENPLVEFPYVDVEKWSSARTRAAQARTQPQQPNIYSVLDFDVMAGEGLPTVEEWSSARTRAAQARTQPQQPNIYSVLDFDVMAGEGRETTDPQETTDESAQVVA
jgi:hypothetical protein